MIFNVKKPAGWLSERCGRAQITASMRNNRMSNVNQLSPSAGAGISAPEPVGESPGPRWFRLLGRSKSILRPAHGVKQVEEKPHVMLARFFAENIAEAAPVTIPSEAV